MLPPFGPSLRVKIVVRKPAFNQCSTYNLGFRLALISRPGKSNIGGLCRFGRKKTVIVLCLEYPNLLDQISESIDSAFLDRFFSRRALIVEGPI